MLGFIIVGVTYGVALSYALYTQRSIRFHNTIA